MRKRKYKYSVKIEKLSLLLNFLVNFINIKFIIIMAKWEDFKDTKECKMWKAVRDAAELLNITEDSHSSNKDIPEYWEPFLERLFKLGVFFKYVGKLKELKMEWIRPMYICSNLENQRIKIEEREYTEAIKENVYLCGDICQSFRPFIVTLYDYDKLDKLDNNAFKKKKKEFQDQVKKIFTVIIKFVKTGYRNIQEVMNLILKNILDLVNANYELFCLESKISGIKDLTIFHDKKDNANFIENLKSNKNL